MVAVLNTHENKQGETAFHSRLREGKQLTQGWMLGAGPELVWGWGWASFVRG